jgi:gliding motility associated protien GldN
MKSVVFSSFILSSIVLYGQGNVGPSNVIIPNVNGSPQPTSGVIDGVYEKKDVLAKKRAIPYEFVRENDYVWGKRTWSYIDLREKINHPLYFPHEIIDQNNQASSPNLLTEYTSQGRYSLYYILANALKKGLIMGYKDRVEADLSLGIPVPKEGGDAFIYPAPRDFSKSVLSDGVYQGFIGELIGYSDLDPTKNEKKDMSTGNAVAIFYKKGSPTEPKVYLNGDPNMYAVDPQTETINPADAEIVPGTANDPFPVEYRVRTQKYLNSNRIIKYLLKEDWFFDKERSILDVRTIGLAPVIFDSVTQKETIKFWVYFPQARDVLKNYYVYDPKSTVGGNTFDHLFMTRRFNAVIYKESTLYDRKIEDYRFGADALYESEKVKNTIRTFEHDVWNF